MNAALNLNHKTVSNYCCAVKSLLVGGIFFPRAGHGIHVLRVRYLRARILPWRYHLRSLLPRTVQNNGLGEFLLHASARSRDPLVVRFARSCSFPFRLSRLEIGDRIFKCFKNRVAPFFKPKTGWALPWLNDVAESRYLIFGIPVVAQEDGRGFNQIVAALQHMVLRFSVHESILTEDFHDAPVESNSMFGSAHCVLAFNQAIHENQNRWRESGVSHPAKPHFSSC